MLLVGLAAAAALLALSWFALRFYRVELQLQARGEPSGHYAVVGAVGALGAVVSVAAAAGVTPRLQLHFRGYRLLNRELRWPVGSAPKSASAASPWRAWATERARRAGQWALLFVQEVDPIRAVELVLAQRRALRITRLAVTARFSFLDVALTGRLLAAGLVLSVLLPSPLRLQVEPEWAAADRAGLDLDGELWLSPGRVALSLLLAALRYFPILWPLRRLRRWRTRRLARTGDNAGGSAVERWSSSDVAPR